MGSTNKIPCLGLTVNAPKFPAICLGLKAASKQTKTLLEVGADMLLAARFIF